VSKVPADDLFGVPLLVEQSILVKRRSVIRRAGGSIDRRYFYANINVRLLNYSKFVLFWDMLLVYKKEKYLSQQTWP
jgi:hypothetical protein